MEDAIKIGIIGMRFGATVLRNIQNCDARSHVRVSAVCDIDFEKARAAAEPYGLRAYADLEEMVRAERPEAVALFTPPAGRAQLIGRLMDMGLHVMTTKPFELDPAAARDILRRSVELGRVVHINSPGPVKSALATAILGAAAEYDLGIPVGFRQDIWVNYDEQPDGGWYDDVSRCPAAPIFRLGIYIINDMVRIFGAARRVSVFGSRLVTGRPTADNTQLSILFQNGAVGGIFGSFCVDDSLRYNSPLVVNYQRGSFFCRTAPDGSGALTLVRRDPAEERYNPKTHVLTEIPMPGMASGAYDWAGFAASVRQRRTVSAEYIDAVTNGLEVIRAMAESERTGQVEECKYSDE